MLDRKSKSVAFDDTVIVSDKEASQQHESPLKLSRQNKSAAASIMTPKKHHSKTYTNGK